jgi:hypothetical protein
MYIYNVTIKILPSIETEWLTWMEHEHLDEVISTGCFDSYSFLKLIDPISDDDGITYIAQYFTDSKERYEMYINEHAPRLREIGYARFGAQFIAFRTVLQKIK